MLAGVLDPELRASIVDLGMVHDIDVDPDGDVTVKVALTTAACPLRGQIGNDVRSKVAGLPGVGEVNVEYDEMTQEERSNVMQRARLQASQSAPPTEISATTRVIAVGSGKGGVGKSSITANLAAALAARGLHGRRARRRHLGLLDPAHARRAGAPRRLEDTPTARARSCRSRSRSAAACCGVVSAWACSSTTRTPRSCGAA